MLTDSAGEQAAIKKAFPGLEVCEMEVSHLLCTVHSERTLQRHFGGESKRPILKHLTTALYIRKTKAGCHDSIDAAIKACSQSKDKDLIKSGTRQLHRGQCMLANIQAFFFKCEQTQLSLGTTLGSVEESTCQRADIGNS
jgi:hypothetical protein